MALVDSADSDNFVSLSILLEGKRVSPVQQTSARLASRVASMRLSGKCQLSLKIADIGRTSQFLIAEELRAAIILDRR